MQWILTDYTIEDNSFVSLRNVTFGYSFPRKFISKYKLNRFRLYVSGTNLLTVWSKEYRGLNPESLWRGGMYSTPLVAGYQRVGDPINISGTIGLHITF